MSERDALAELLQDHVTDSLPVDPFRDEIRSAVESAADVLWAAGYRKSTVHALKDDDDE